MTMKLPLLSAVVCALLLGQGHATSVRKPGVYVYSLIRVQARVKEALKAVNERGNAESAELEARRQLSAIRDMIEEALK